ncbi:MAG: type III pantothenate kinase [Flavobacteriaceae bacterium]
MLLAVDIGNSRIKYAVFEKNTLLELFASEKFLVREEIGKILFLYPDISVVMVSSVRELTKNDFSGINKNIEIRFVTHDSDFPFVNKYKTPKTLGIDRMILASGASLKYPNQNKLIIDAGTAITYDFIDEKNNYFGGAISAGINLRYKALNDYTAKLPLLQKTEDDFFLGITTSESIHSGVVNGVLFEIEGFINRLRNRYDNFIIILTGGDTDFLAKRLKNTIFANRNFLLESLNDLYQFQK